MAMFRIEHYLTVDGQKDLYIDWLRRLRDSQAKVAVVRRVVLLLCGGDKRTQSTDIDRAVDYWHDWQRRIEDEKQTE